MPSLSHWRVRLQKEVGGNRLERSCEKTSADHNTDATANVRAGNVHTWEGDIPPAGSTIVLVDDTFTTGQTIQSLAQHLRPACRP